MKKSKWLAALLAGMLFCSLSSITAFAQTNETEETAASTEAAPVETLVEETPTETEEPEEEEELPPLTPDGNLTLVDDISTNSGKQFITVVTKNKNYFYLIIDRDDEGNQTVHFLNQVDEEDLLNLMEDEDAEAIREAMSEQETKTTTVEETKEEPEEETVEPAVETTEKKQNMGLLAAAGVLIIALGGIGIWIFMQTKRKKKPNDQPDPDADYREDEDSYNLPEEEEPEGPANSENRDEEE